MNSSVVSVIRNGDVGLFADGDSAIFVEGSRFLAASFDA